MKSLINEKHTETALPVQQSIIHFLNEPAMLLFVLKNPLFPVTHTQTNLLNMKSHTSNIFKNHTKLIHFLWGQKQ